MKTKTWILCALCALCIFLSAPMTASAAQSAEPTSSSDASGQPTEGQSHQAEEPAQQSQENSAEGTTGGESDTDNIGQQGTEGDELQVVQPEQMEIDLGTNYAGLEFLLETDFGTYPDPVMVDADGVLRFEVGGSSFYRLTNLGTYGDSGSTQGGNGQDQLNEPERTPQSIPLRNIVIFAVGCCVAVVGLLLLNWDRRKRGREISTAQRPEDDDADWSDEAYLPENEEDDDEEI